MKIPFKDNAFRLIPALLLSASAVGQNLISNGSFETTSPPVSTNGVCGTVSSLPTCTVTDWTGTNIVGNGPGNVNGASYGIPQPDPNGVNALILQGTDSASQQVTLPVSGEYSLTLYLANRSNEDSGPQTVTVSLDSVLIEGGTFATIPYSWTKEALSFSATAGSHTLTLAGLGDSGADVSAFVDEVTLEAVGVATTTTLTVSSTTAPQGAPIALTALVKPASGSAAPGGTVTFNAGSKALGKVTLNATGQASLTTSSLPVGSNSIVAVYSGSSTFDSSTSAAVKVTITAGPVVSFSPSSVAFTSTIVGTVSDDRAITLTNSGSSALSITSIGVTGAQASSFVDISTCGTSLAVGKSCAIYVGFAPKKAGTATATLSVADNAAVSPQTVTLTGTGVAAPALTVAPATLGFPATPVGGSSAGQSVTLTNPGTAVVSITSIVLNGADPEDFVTLNNCGTDLAASATCTVYVAFTPTVAGARTATLSVADDATGSPQTVKLSGTGN